jgi:hypothetical protein
MNDKSIPREIDRLPPLRPQGDVAGEMHGFATAHGDSEVGSNMLPRELQDARKMSERYIDRLEKEAEMLLADLQSNGDIQIRLQVGAAIPRL